MLFQCSNGELWWPDTKWGSEYRIEGGERGFIISLEEMMQGKILCREKMSLLLLLFFFSLSLSFLEEVRISRDKSLKNGA